MTLREYLAMVLVALACAATLVGVVFGGKALFGDVGTVLGGVVALAAIVVATGLAVVDR